MRVIDLFSGCGGLSLGFENAGYNIVAAYDNWQPAIAVHKANFTHPIFNIDLSDAETAIKHISGYQPQMIIGGPPCQDFSSAGKRHPRSYARRGIFSVNEPSPTIRGVNRPIPKGYNIHPNDPIKSLDGVRPLTTKERSMIQTFPERFIFTGGKNDLEQMIGNAVPVKLGEFVASSINSYIKTCQNVCENCPDNDI